MQTKNKKPSGSGAGKQVPTWSTRVLRNPYLSEGRGLGEGRAGAAAPCCLGAGVSTEVQCVEPAGRLGTSRGALLALFPQEGWMTVPGALAHSGKQVLTVEVRTRLLGIRLPCLPWAASSSPNPSLPKDPTQRLAQSGSLSLPDGWAEPEPAGVHPPRQRRGGGGRKGAFTTQS